jgi:hypothetical protein
MERTVAEEPPAVSNSGWSRVLEEKALDLDRLANWASAVGHGKVRDLCRAAAYELRESKKLYE